MPEEYKPILAVTMGDPASIGPELCLKALARQEILEICRPVVVGDAGVLEAAKAFVGGALPAIHSIAQLSQANFAPGLLNLLDLRLTDAKSLAVGQVSPQAGEASYRYVAKAIELAMSNEVDGTVTNAISKEAINLAGHHYAGHTEIYAHLTNTPKYTMMLAHENLRVVHVSTHVSLRQACDAVRRQRVLEVIQIANKACKALGIARPKIGVAGLNPHSGEGGLFGREEMEEILPAIQEAQAAGIDAAGPIPPDTVFPKAKGGMYDIVVAMYHDQGHIPLKLAGFAYNPQAKGWNSVDGVNITLGIPIIRTSVDHGTAFDQAGKGTASVDSLCNAIRYAVTLARVQKASNN